MAINLSRPGSGAGKAPLRLAQADVERICARHDRLWQSKPGGARAVFAWMDLSGVDLAGKNLCDADFTGAVMVGCNLSGARLDHASASGR